MSHQNNHAEPQSPLAPIDDEAELALYQLQAMLLLMASQLKLKSPTSPRDIKGPLQYLHGKDAQSTHMVRRYLHTAGTLLEEASAILTDRIDWVSVEAFYCPPDGGFIDVPSAWIAVDRANAQRAANGAAAHNGSAPANVPAVTPEAPAALNGTAAKPPSKVALRRLGRTIRTGVEAEKRRFYAIATRYGLPTQKGSEGAMLAALSALFGDELTSRRQMDERRWSRAASAIETEELTWSMPGAGVPEHSLAP